MLDVYLDERLVAHLDRVSPARFELRYTAEAVAAPASLSIALPARDEPYGHEQVAPFFEGLLPEGQALATIARGLGLSPTNVFALLERIGADCGGAVTVVPHGRESSGRQVATRPLDDAGLAQLVADLPRRPLGLDAEGNVRLSLAGAQDKLVLVREPDGSLALPLGGTPSTHILKVQIAGEGLDDTVVNEAFCLAVCSRAGIPTVTSQIVAVAGEPALLVERYDRIRSGGRVVRIHQEDVCQAMAIPPAAKYEAEGGPSALDLVTLARSVLRPPAAGVLRVVDQLVARFVLGDHDGHGKNTSFVYGSAGMSLAPLYDVVATAAYRALSKKLAMRIGGEYRGDFIEGRHWDRLGEAAGLGVPAFRARRRRLGEALIDAARAERTIFQEHGNDRPVIDRIVTLIDRRAARL